MSLRGALKAAANAAATALVAPAAALYGLSCLVVGPERALPGWSQALAIWPGLTGTFLRRAFYRLTTRRCGADALLGFGALLTHPGAELGRRVYVGPFCVLGDVVLEDDVLLGSHVSVTNGARQHGIDRLDVPIREQPGSWRRVVIGRDSWVGDRSVVMADVGRHCVVGAGSVVTRPIPDFAVAVGSPARVIRYRGEAPEPSRGTAASSRHHA
jgi:acetyltransferase-like isoleucine patch superfamily enzyme